MNYKRLDESAQKPNASGLENRLYEQASKQTPAHKPSGFMKSLRSFATYALLTVASALQVGGYLQDLLKGLNK